ncbi:MAG: proprotein convertase P-domain-containing protein [Myxococcota bacterium]
MKTRAWNWTTAGMALVLGVVCLAPAAAWASIPTTTLVEGALAGADGSPVADGDYTMRFSLYKTSVDSNPVWSEGPVQVAVKDGQLSYLIGTTAPLAASDLAQAAWLGIQVATDPELTRTPLASAPFALRSTEANGIACSGCLPLSTFDQNEVSAYVNAQNLATVATSGNLADFSGAPDFSVYATASKLAKVASTGSYADLSGVPDLSGAAKVADLADYAKGSAVALYAKAANLKKVATTGAYADLANLPTVPKLGVLCGTGLVVKGIKADGSMDCVAGAATVLKGDDLAVVSNGLLTNIFTDVFANTTAVGIPDNNPTGASSTIVVGDVGSAQKLTVSIKVTNSDISTLTVKLYDANNTEYVLHKTSGSGASIDTTYPAPTAVVSGDLTTWVGKNPKGNWRLLVIDGKFLNNTTDGQIVSWSVNLTTMSNKKINVKGDLYVDGSITLAAGSPVPAGMILPFNQAACPAGWSPADGASNRPNLLGRFPIGIGALPQGGSVALRDNGGSHMWRIYGGGTGWGSRGCFNQDLINHGIGWQGETDVTAGRGTGWTGYSNHLPPYAGLLYCVKD